MSKITTRPHLHFTAKKNWINDPNGLIYFEGEYHLFFQHNPFGLDWGHMSWGHAVSSDLIHWEELEIALPEEDGVMIFSGSVVYDELNTSGFGKDSQSPLVAIYTMHISDEDKQAQGIAYSLDKGRTWTKYAGNPVIDIQEPHFRDPKVFWHDGTERWIMVVSVAESLFIQFYSSLDLKNWTYLSRFGPEGKTNVTNWECPDLFQVCIKNYESESAWVLKVDIGDNSMNGGSGSQYFIGHFDGDQFINYNDPDHILWVDNGTDFYAAQSFNNISNERRIWLAWMSNCAYSHNIPTYPWRGAMTFPREIFLLKTGNKLKICQEPVREIEHLRDKVIDITELEVNAHKPNILIDSDSFFPLECVLEVKNLTAVQFCFRIITGKDEYIEVGCSFYDQTIYVDRTNSYASHLFEACSNRFSVAALDLTKPVKLHFILDATSIECFVNEGETVFSVQAFLDGKKWGIETMSSGGMSLVNSLKVYNLGGPSPV